MKILYNKQTEYFKIVAIKPDDFIFGSEELNEEKFGILKADISEIKIKAWLNYNKYCVNEAATGTITTPAQYQLKDPENIPEFIIPELPKHIAPKGVA